MPTERKTDRGLITRMQCAKRLGVSITTFRRRYEGDMGVKPSLVEADGKALFDPKVIEEVVEENFPPPSLEQLTLLHVREAGSIGIESLSAGVDVLHKTSSIQERARDALERENVRLTGRVTQLETENDGLRRQHREWLDDAYKRAREDKRQELDDQQREEWQKQAGNMAKYVVPAGMALLGRLMGAPMPEAAKDALSSVFGSLKPDRVGALIGEISNSPNLTIDEKFAIGAAVESLRPKESKPVDASRSLDDRGKDVAARLKAVMAEAEAIDAEAKAAELAKTKEQTNGAAAATPAA